MAAEPIVLRVKTDVPDDTSSLRRSSSWMWEWKQSPASSRNSSVHGGSLLGFSSREASGHGGSAFSTSREGSMHGGSRMKRNVSFSSDLTDGAPTIASPRGMRRTGSWVWDWATTSPPASTPASREGSLHNANEFTDRMPPLSERPQCDESEADSTTIGALEPLVRSMSFLWDWGKDRVSPPATPATSLHGGSAFLPDEDATTPPEPAIKPPKSLVRNLSMGSFLFDWSAPTWRASPPSTPGTSLRGGSEFLPSGEHRS